MPLDKIMDMIKSEPDEYVQLEAEEEKPAGGVTIQIEHIGHYTDSERIQQKVRDGIILLVRIKDLKDKDMNELKRAIARIRRTCHAVNGDIAGLGDEWLIVTPAVAKVRRELEE